MSRRRQWHPTLVLLPRKSHGRRNLVGCSPWGRRVRHDWATSLWLFTFMHWRRKWQPTPVFLPRESQGWGSLVGCHLWSCRVGHDWSDLAAAAAAGHVKCQAGWIKSWNQDCQEKYQHPQICRWYYSNGRKQRETKKPLNVDERKKWKAGLKLNIKNTEITASDPTTS